MRTYLQVTILGYAVRHRRGGTEMLDLANTSPSLLDPVSRVVAAAVDATEELAADQMMIVGAWCRDILHSSLGHTFATAATRDLALIHGR
jgi:hypothetical protein